MAEANLLVICVSAFVAVFVLLAFLAGVMRVLMAVFPEKVAGGDPALMAALAAAVSVALPGTEITKVEEIR